MARTVEISKNKVIGSAEKSIINVLENVATFKTGLEVNFKMMKLAGAGNLSVEYEEMNDLGTITLPIICDENGEYYNDNIIEIKKSTEEQYISEKDSLTDENIVSIENSKKPIYMWFDNGIIYYYTEAEIVYLNEDASYMFACLTAMQNKNIKQFNTSKVKNMTGFLSTNYIYEKDVEGIDTSNVTNMSWMFSGSYLVDGKIGDINTENVTNMQGMFSRTFTDQSLNLNSLNTKNVTDMSQMFMECEIPILEIEQFDTSNVTNMYGMFAQVNFPGIGKLDVSNFDTSNVTNMYGMFASNKNLVELDVSNFDTKNVQYFDYMFYGCDGVTELDVSNFDVSKTESLDSMFEDCSGIKQLDLSNFNTNNITEMRKIFEGCTNLEVIYVSDKFNVVNVTDSFDMFAGCSKLVGGNGTTYDSSKEDKTYARIDKSNEPGYFTDIADKPKE